MEKFGANTQAIQDFLYLTDVADDTKRAANFIRAEKVLTREQNIKETLEDNERKVQEYLQILDSNEYKQVLEQMKRNERSCG